MPYRPLHVIARSNATKQSILRLRRDGLLRLARNDVEGFTPTRWLAMTWRGSRRNDEPVARMEQREIRGRRTRTRSLSSGTHSRDPLPTSGLPSPTRPPHPINHPSPTIDPAPSH